MGEKQAILFVTISTLIITLGALFPVWPMLIFFAMWLSHAFYKEKFALKPTPSIVPGALLVLLCLFSMFWALNPGYALYNATQFAVYYLCLIIIARIVDLRSLIIGLAIGFFIVMLVNLTSNNFMIVYATGERALTGVVGNKNVVGHLAAVAALIGFCLLVWDKNFKLKPAYLLLFLLSLLCLYLSKSATSIIAAALTMGACVAMHFVCKLPSGLRILSMAICAFAAISVYVALIGSGMNVFEEILALFNKNPNLTGRTWLWSEGIERFKESFWGGYGYKTFWVPGNSYAQFYWDAFSYEGTKGFHFHNLFIETAVELGIVGLVLMVFLTVSALARIIYLVSKHGMDLNLAFAMSMIVLQLIRSITEVNLLGPFGLGFFLFFILYFKMWPYQPQNVSTKVSNS